MQTSYITSIILLVLYLVQYSEYGA
jgi:hypothetical protein